MKHIKNIFFSIFIIILFLKTAFCDFEFTGAGARPAVFGNSYTALSDDAYGIYYNPGGLSFIGNPQISADYAQLWMGISDGSTLSNGFIGGIYPAGEKTGTFGCSLQNFSLVGYYAETTLDIAYSKKVLNTLGIGIGIKQLSQKYTMDDYSARDDVFRNGTRTGKTVTSLDLGALWKIYKGLFLGVSMINVNQPDIGFGESESLPLTTNMALAYRTLSSFNMAFGFSSGENTNKTTVGVEKKFFKDFFALRFGYGFGSKQDSNLSTGIGLCFRQATVDYAFILPSGGLKETDGTQRLSFSYVFGKLVKDDPDLKRITEPYESRVKELEGTIAGLQLQIKNIQEQRDKIIEDTVNERLKNTQEELLKKQEELEAEKNKKEVKPVPEKPAARTYTVQSGDTLPSIAKQYYDDMSKWKIIFDANKNKIERGRIVPGQVLVIP